MILHDRSKDGSLGFCPDIPRAFTCLEEARNSLDFHWNSCIQLLNAIEQGGPFPDPDPVGFQAEINRLKCSSVCEQWLAAFQAFLQHSGKTLDSKAWQAARVLQISQEFAKTYLDASAFSVLTDETVWDKYCSRYESIVLLAASILEESSRDANITPKRGPAFCIDMNIVAPLYAVAHKCRHPVVRRKAVSLLYFTPRQEGIWDSVLTARVAERLIEIEERGLGRVTCCYDVPDWARISDVNIKFDLQGRLGTVRYSRQRSSLEKVRDTVEETVKW
ncbi:hypothetical protein MMC28_004318 [Mycoblastus sanguinarius]|nr:hypothetical protein [Mycoblastus sanguinarius]